MVVDDGLAPSQPLPPLFVLPRLDGSFVDFDFRRRFLSGSGVAFGDGPISSTSSVGRHVRLLVLSTGLSLVVSSGSLVC